MALLGCATPLLLLLEVEWPQGDELDQIKVNLRGRKASYHWLNFLGLLIALLLPVVSSAPACECLSVGSGGKFKEITSRQRKKGEANGHTHCSQNTSKSITS